jgi:hypothetical protein
MLTAPPRFDVIRAEDLFDRPARACVVDQIAGLRKALRNARPAGCLSRRVIREEAERG